MSKEKCKIEKVQNKVNCILMYRIIINYTNQTEVNLNGNKLDISNLPLTSMSDRDIINTVTM